MINWKEIYLLTIAVAFMVFMVTTCTRHENYKKCVGYNLNKDVQVIQECERILK